MAHSAALMAETDNQHCQDISITIGKRVWFPTEYLKIPPPLSHKLAARFVGLLLVLCAIGPVSF